MNTRIRVAAVVAALSLALSVSGTTLAGTQTSAGAEDATVTSALTFQGVPATISYGSIVQGKCASYAPFNVDIGNANAGFDLSITATNLTKTAPSATIAVTQRSAKFTLSGSTAGVAKQPNATNDWWLSGSWDASSCGYNMYGWNGTYGTTEQPILSRTGGGTATLTTLAVQLGLSVPVAQAVGAYTGSMTFKFTTP